MKIASQVPLYLKAIEENKMRMCVRILRIMSRSTWGSSRRNSKERKIQKALTQICSMPATLTSRG